MTRRTPAQYDWDKLLFDETILTRHFTPQSSKDVKFIVVHHMVIKDRDKNDDDALDTCYNIWQTRRASAQYGVDNQFIRQFVWDKDSAWATGNGDGNRFGISIEHVNETLDQAGTENDYLVSQETWQNGARLAAYLHRAYGMGRPVKDKTLRKHKSFTKTACPGPYFDKIWNEYVAFSQAVYDVITAPGTPVTPNKFPSDVIDLTNVKVTLPTKGSDGNPKEVKQPQLKTYSDASFHMNENGDGVVFEARCDGFHTENSSYPRSEAREMTNKGKDLAKWNSGIGDHKLQGTLIITETPKKKPEIVVAQIHDAKDDVIMLRYEGTRFFVERDGKEVLLLDPTLKLRDRFDYEIRANKSGLLVTYYNRETKRQVSKLVTSKTFKDCYFKFGVYTQSNVSKGDRPSAKGRVVYYSAKITHS